MRTKYYKITGLDEGFPIKPFAVTLDDLDSALTESGDMSRRYEEITKDEYDAMISADLAEIYGTELRDKQRQHEIFSQLIAQLVTMRFEFQVYNCMLVQEDTELAEEDKHRNLSYIIPSIKYHLGKDILMCIVQLNNTEHVLYEFDENGVINVIEELKNW
jgi:hypothetical protein